jgi:hypothetical protein
VDELEFLSRFPETVEKKGEVFLTNDEMASLTFRLEPVMQRVVARVKAQHNIAVSVWSTRKVNAFLQHGVSLCWGPTPPRSKK